MANLSLFGTLNTALLGVYTHKLAMNVVGHNIANANTEGYSRQRPVIEPTPPIPLTTLTQPSIPLMLGTGSQVKDIQRVRDLFLDIQFRQVSNRYNYWNTIFSNLHFFEQLLAEPGSNGLRNLYDAFALSFEEVMSDPSNSAAKRQIVSRAEELVNAVKDLYSRLEQLREDINKEIKLLADKINQLVSRLKEINEQVRIAVALKTTPNDLLDERDRILDELASYGNIIYRETEDGQTILTFGDQVVLSGSVQNYVKALERPYGKGFYELFVGITKLSILDGKLKALIDLRDAILVRYMIYLDEFALNLTDKLNLIHRAGFDASGKTTNLNFFNLNPAVETLEPAVFRIVGSRRMMLGPIKTATGLHDYTESDIRSTTLTQAGRLIFFDGISSEQLDIPAGTTVNDLVGPTGEADLTSWLKLRTVQHEPAPSRSAFRLILDTSESGVNLNDVLIIDEASNVLKTLGFETQQKTFITFNDLSKLSLGTYTLVFEETFPNGTKHSETLNLSIDETTTINDIMNQVNTQLTNIKTLVVNDSLVLVPTKDLEFDWSRVQIKDEFGFLTQVRATNKTFDVLKPTATLENIFHGSTNFDGSIGYQLYIGNTPIHIDPAIDTLESLVKKINEANTGVLADLTPHRALVLRAGRSFEFDLRNFNIVGPKGLFEALGLIDTNADPNDFNADWDEEFTLISKSDDFNSLRSRLNVSELFIINRRERTEPFYFVMSWDVSSVLKTNSEALAIDAGKALFNNAWNASSILPVGLSNVDIIRYMRDAKYERLLADGKESFFEYFGGIIAELGVESETAQKMRENNEALRLEIDQERERVKGVSLDEEMANMIKYQHAFAAAARVITAVDEMIGRVIDKLGVVGR
ncbi:flagellar hook-associated protein FlgK [Pseudothermotoga sp.]|uniref:flagellar hook-associated protein FlgK n=1 Tax=Pseudothermotoga sp. TaxID=2033661 RepID=UPI0031F6EFDC